MYNMDIICNDNPDDLIKEIELAYSIKVNEDIIVNTINSLIATIDWQRMEGNYHYNKTLKILENLTYSIKVDKSIIIDIKMKDNYY